MYEKEEWRPVVGYEGLYEVSNIGNVRSLNRKGRVGKGYGVMKGRVLKPAINRDGYKCVVLCKNCEMKTVKVHRLVAQAFLDNPNKLPCVNHKNEIKTDNRLENLEWCTYKYNNEYSGSIEKMINSNKKPIIQLTKNNEFIAEYESVLDAGSKTETHRGSISECCLNKRKSAGGYKWKYKSDYEKERTNS